ncbi:hypothetical protein GGR56DRAFT_629247 [Xylariaceae sp. FL0804]|nr:hypothetical protein GGR56DRAFT_629247 [Xylariaceae sp. FL0804]
MLSAYGYSVLLYLLTYLLPKLQVPCCAAWHLHQRRLCSSLQLTMPACIRHRSRIAQCGAARHRSPSAKSAQRHAMSSMGPAGYGKAEQRLELSVPWPHHHQIWSNLHITRQQLGVDEKIPNGPRAAEWPSVYGTVSSTGTTVPPR